MSTNEPKSNAPASDAPTDAEKDQAKHADEADFLTRQADEAKAAIASALADAKAALAEGIDPREWTRRYPFVALGSAVAAGFVAAVLTIPSKEQQELKKLEKIRRAMHPEVDEVKSKTKAAVADAADEAKAESHKHSFWSTILREAVQMIRPILISAMTAGLGAKAAQNADGRPPDRAPGS
ncbi:MAG TPA: hypothetical protein VLI90_10780 [Tepidisphaeraceae bacterium]|nr:hypothetical protein [Tepidisphaeraceae bacterium]